MANELKSDAIKREIFYIVSALIVGFLFTFAKLGNDDIVFNKQIGYTVRECWHWSAAQYDKWSSRVIINFSLALLIRGKKLGAFMYFSVSMYVLIKALSMLWSDLAERTDTVIIIATAMMFPWKILTTAGWMATSTSYFGPVAFGLLSLVPIKKACNGEKITWWEIILYSGSVIYATNAEQTCAAVFLLYLIAIICLSVKKKNKWYTWLFLTFTVISLIFILTCPGNAVRTRMETFNWFPAYNVLDIADKLDIGVTTTLDWLFSGSCVLVISMCLLMTVLVFRKYKNACFRIISVFPTATVILIGPLKNIIFKVFPDAARVYEGIDFYGSFTATSQGTGIGPLRFFVFLLICVCLCIDLILLSNTVQELITNLSLTLVAMGTRVVMGFSPTVHASLTRTFAITVVCLMAVQLHIYLTNKELLSDRKSRICVHAVMCAVIVLSYIDLAFLTVTTFK